MKIVLRFVCCLYIDCSLRVVTESSILLQDSTSKPIPIMLCGNKTDLRESFAEEGNTIISAERGEKLAKVNYIYYTA